MAVLRRFYERYGELFGPRALRSFDELERALRRGGFLTRWLDRVLPLPQPEKLVSRLLTSPAALEAASDGVLDADERKLLLRDRPRRMSDLRWSDQDVPLLDEARTLLAGAPRSYGHVIVDEAQDLSPMQLLAISRRAVDGSLTILGDVAQATGPVVYRRWQELEPYLPDEAELEIEELRHAYRVPAEIMDFALPLLDRIAPEVEPPLAYRKGGDPPRLVRVAEDELLAAALREAAALAEQDGLLAVIVPRSLARDAAAGRALRRDLGAGADAAPGEGPRVRPRRRRRAGGHRRRRRPGPARALRRAHAADEDARRRPRAAAARAARPLGVHVPDVHGAEPRRIESLVSLAGARILDVGCGEGRLTGLAAALSRERVRVRPECRARASKRERKQTQSASDSACTAPRRSTSSARASMSRSAVGRSDASSRRAWSTP